MGFEALIEMLELVRDAIVEREKLAKDSMKKENDKNEILGKGRWLAKVPGLGSKLDEA